MLQQLVSESTDEGGEGWGFVCHGIIAYGGIVVYGIMVYGIMVYGITAVTVDIGRLSFSRDGALFCFAALLC